MEERASKRFKDIGAMWRVEGDGHAKIWLARPGPASDWSERVLRPVDYPLIRAALEQFAPAGAMTGDDYFCILLYAHVLKNVSVVWQYDGPNTRTLKYRASLIRDKKQQAEITKFSLRLATEPVTESDAWHYFFIGLKHYADVDASSREMQSFKKAILKLGRMMHVMGGEATGTLECFERHLKSRPAEKALYSDWMSVAIHRAATLIGKVSIQIATECVGRALSQEEQQGFLSFYGATSFMGGANIIFLGKLLRPDLKYGNKLRTALLSLLDLPASGAEGEEAERMRESIRRDFAIRYYLWNEVQEYDNERKKKRIDSIPNDTIPDPSKENRKVQIKDLIEKLLRSLDKEKRIIFGEQLAGIAAGETARRHPEFGDAEKISKKRWRIKEHLTKMFGNDESIFQ